MSCHTPGRCLSIVLFVLAIAVVAYNQTPAAVVTGKEPVIIIPGLTGSELVNSKTGEKVWFKARRSKDDDLRLPISPNLARNHDNLVVGDIIRSVKVVKFVPETEIYERLIDALQTRGGYKEGNWKKPAKDGDRDTFYVFPYDWRRDNVENARLLIRQIDQLRRTLGKPNVKFNVIAHSMGGLIARYAARFGNVDIPAASTQPTWAGAKYFDKIFLLGTPNEGSVGALNAMLDGFSYMGGVKLPFIQDISKFDIFTIPSAYQLLPHEGTLVAYDEKLQPITLDIYDPKTWEQYNWTVWQDPAFTKKMSPVEQRDAKAFFAAALARAKQFQAALDAPSKGKIPISFYLMGADCKDTENALIIIRDEKKDRWRTIFKPGAYTAGDGTKFTDEQLKPLLVAMGDGEVTKRSLTGSTLAENGIRVSFSPVEDLFQCESHSRLVTNPEIQDKLLTVLAGTAK